MTLSNPLRVGLIGAGGRWGPRAHVPALKGVPETDLYAVCTAHAETAQKAADKFGVECAYGVEHALRLARDEPISVIGGSDIFALFLPLADRIELTEILEDIPGDTSWPDPRHSGEWRELSSEEHPAEGGCPAYRFLTLERA